MRNKRKLFLTMGVSVLTLSILGTLLFSFPIFSENTDTNHTESVVTNDYAASPTLKITKQPKPMTVKEGSIAKVTVEASGSNLSYKWYVRNKGGEKFYPSSISSSAYSVKMNKQVDGRQLYCVVTNRAGKSVTSDVVTLYNAHTIAITKQPKNTTVKNGKIANVTVAASGSKLTYKWYVRNKGGEKFYASSIKSATYSVKMNAKVNGRQLYCVITDGSGKSVKTNVVTLQSDDPITIVSQPKHTSQKKGSVIRVPVKATGTNLTYTWYVRNKNSTAFSVSSNTSSAYTANMSDKVNGRQVFCVISNGSGKSVKTNVVTLHMTGQIAINEQPKDVSAGNGKIATISVKASGTNLTYTWWIRNRNNQSFSRSSITGPEYAARITEKVKGRQVFCVVKDKNGKTVTSNLATLHMADPVIITKQPTDAVANDNEIVRVHTKATGENLKYTWYVRNKGGEKFYRSSTTGSEYSAVMSPSVSGRQVYCVITDKNNRSATTKIVTLTNSYDHVYEETPVGKTEKGYAFLKKCKVCSAKEYVYYDALLTFVDDDGKADAMLHWENIIDETGIKMTAALVGSQMCDYTNYDYWAAYSGWDLLGRLQKKGVDYVNHTYYHKRLTTLTEAELNEDFRKVKKALKAYGIDSDILVYPFNAHNALVDKVAAKYFNAGFCGEDVIITDIAADPFGLTRVNVNDKNLTQYVAFSKTNIVECLGVKPLSTFKTEIHDALKQKGWLVCLSHAYDSPSGKYYFDRESEKSIIDFCHYVQKMPNVKIVTLTEGKAASTEISKLP